MPTHTQLTRPARLLLLAALALLALSASGVADAAKKTPAASSKAGKIARAKAVHKAEVAHCRDLQRQAQVFACIRHADALLKAKLHKLQPPKKPVHPPTPPKPSVHKPSVPSKPSVASYRAIDKSGFVVGVNDDSLKWTLAPTPVINDLLGLGATSVRLTVDWSPGQTDLTDSDLAALNRIVPAALGIKILLNPITWGGKTPISADQQGQYCTYVKNIMARYPQVRSTGIGNEVNKANFWRPQFNENGTSAAPAAYVRLLASCYDLLHASFADVNVVTSLSPRGNDNPNASSNVSHSPLNFLKKMGAAYRTSGRSKPIYDTFGQNVYGLTSAEPVLKNHDPGTVGLGDYDELVGALNGAFKGTAQDVPGENGSQIWYLEEGFQTKTGGHNYTGTENDPAPLSAQAQADQLTAALKASYCQPYVGAFYNFHLADETDLAAWQSGVEYADGTHKPSYAAVSRITAQIKAGTLACK
jgi:hypothetical protein